jgi:hypothetical protein
VWKSVCDVFGFIGFDFDGALTALSARCPNVCCKATRNLHEAESFVVSFLQAKRRDDNKVVHAIRSQQHYCSRWYNCRIVTVFVSQYGTSLSDDFSMDVSPMMTVKAFLDAVKIYPKNKQRSAVLFPYDPSVLVKRGEKKEEGGLGPNCSFDISNLDATIVEAGMTTSSFIHVTSMVAYTHRTVVL